MKKELSKHLMGFGFEVPEIGYYLFYDRHREADNPYDTEKMWKHGSVDFSVVILDTNDSLVYYIEKDT